MLNNSLRIPNSLKNPFTGFFGEMLIFLWMANLWVILFSSKPFLFQFQFQFQANKNTDIFFLKIDAVH